MIKVIMWVSLRQITNNIVTNITQEINIKISININKLKTLKFLNTKKKVIHCYLAI